MNADAREARWKNSYENQKNIFEAKKARKEHYLMEQKSLVDSKIQDLEHRRKEIEAELAQVAQEKFISYDSFRENAIRRSEESKTPKSETT